MDSLIASAGRALAAGDALVALKLVALREDPPALALRGLEYDGADTFYCGGGASGKVRAVLRSK